jgi:fumarylpyruvate hydrolase
MAFIFPPHPAVGTAIVGTDLSFPVNRVYCVGRNYAAHAREMGKDPDRDPPFFFLKAADAVVPDGSIVPYPPKTSDYQYEIELVVAIGAEGFRIPADRAREVIYGYAVGLDMTRRDLQLAARAAGRPWDAGKNFPQSAPMAPIHPASAVGHPERGALRLTVNGEVKQEADLGDLIWDVGEIVEHLSRFYRLVPGDLIFTGTPAGVGPVRPGDLLVGTIDGLRSLTVRIGSPD